MNSSDAASSQDTSRYQILLVALLSISFGILFFDRNSLAFLMPFVQPELKLNNTQVGALASALSFAWACAAFGIGYLSDKTGSRKGLLISATVVFSACSFLSGTAQSFGAPLFERTSFGLRANRDGQRLAKHAQLASAELAQARAELAALEGADTGRTVIGVMPLARSFLVPKAALDFLALRPSHSIALLDGTYESLLLALQTGAADFLVGALRSPAPAAGVVEEPLFDDPLAIVVRAGHPLAGQRSAGVRALAAYPWIGAAQRLAAAQTVRRAVRGRSLRGACGID